ncbi:hypothetical protein [Mycoplasma suis]|uniref:Uncharacterized protein n=1 Tax=Mycoplasma suis (strain Illinois) TaxID=768700 RepID=F0QRD8_MYCSL|nr:hypothetical protein [Mycoplasma suis]ADX98058.1 hypothetical protein MSU_0524 [Mycoplasma suis str. Illinois]
MRIPLTGVLKGLPLLALFSVPVAGMYLLEPSHSKLKIQNPGNNQKTRVYLFSDDLKVSQEDNGSVKFSLVNQQQSNGDNQSQTHDKKKPILMVDLDLRDLNRQDLHKFCIPKNGELGKPEAQQTSVQRNEVQSSGNSRRDECNDWKHLESSFWWGNDSKTELIDFLIKEFSKFLQVEHAYNVLFLENSEIEFKEKGKDQKEKDSKKTWEIKKDCELTSSGNKNVLKDLFLNSIEGKEKCSLFPKSLRVKLNLRKDANQNSDSGTIQNQNIEVNSDFLYKRGELQGRIDYSYLIDLFPSEITSNELQQNTKVIKRPSKTFTVKTGNKYSLSPLTEEDKKKDKNLTFLNKNYYSLEFDKLELKNFPDKKSEQSGVINSQEGSNTSR